MNTHPLTRLPFNEKLLQSVASCIANVNLSILKHISINCIVFCGVMAAKILPVLKLAAKVTIAGGAVYVAYDSGLLGGSEQGSDVLEKAKSAVPPAIDEWMKYFGIEVPAVPRVAFAPTESWNSGVRSTFYTLSVGPTRVGEYTTQGLQYLKDLTK